MNPHLFVYGTLRKPFSNEFSTYLSQHATYVSLGYMQGKLYEINGYPGVIHSPEPQDKVTGEIYKLHSPCQSLPHLDSYEGYSESSSTPNEYTRQELTIELEDGTKHETWVYIYNFEVKENNRVTSGDYLDHIGSR